MAELVARRAAVRRPRVRISVRHSRGGPLPEQTAMKKLERNSVNVINVYNEEKLIKSGFVPLNLMTTL